MKNRKKISNRKSKLKKVIKEKTENIIITLNVPRGFHGQFERIPGVEAIVVGNRKYDVCVETKW